MTELPEGYTPWKGDRKFHGMRPLRVLFRCGRESKDVLPAEQWNGVWQPEGSYPYDIIAVKLEDA